jgi:hypothetical protein
MLMRRDPTWRRASVIWTLLTLLATWPPTIYVAIELLRDGSLTADVQFYLILTVLFLGPAASLVLRRSWHSYRLTVVASAVLLAIVAGLSGWLGLLFFPAAAFALIALGTEALTAPRASPS